MARAVIAWCEQLWNYVARTEKTSGVFGFEFAHEEEESLEATVAI